MQDCNQETRNRHLHHHVPAHRFDCWLWHRGPSARQLLQAQGLPPHCFRQGAGTGRCRGLTDAHVKWVRRILAFQRSSLTTSRLKVLNLVGLADVVKAESSVLEALCDATANGEVLGQSGLPSTWAKKYHQPATGIRRTTLNLMLKQMLLNMDVEVREGWELVDIEETDESVTAIFDGGRSVTGSFLIGCDGIKAASRKALLKGQGLSEGLPVYTGLTQVR